MAQTIDYYDYVCILVHRVLAQHASMEVCDECPQPLTQQLIDASET